ncbi:MAG: hypothetical protein AB7N91_27665 [Candidatus Tectimicrobiota bacterium]
MSKPAPIALALPRRTDGQPYQEQQRDVMPYEPPSETLRGIVIGHLTERPYRSLCVP